MRGSCRAYVSSLPVNYSKFKLPFHGCTLTRFWELSRSKLEIYIYLFQERVSKVRSPIGNSLLGHVQYLYTCIHHVTDSNYAVLRLSGSFLSSWFCRVLGTVSTLPFLTLRSGKRVVNGAQPFYALFYWYADERRAADLRCSLSSAGNEFIAREGLFTAPWCGSGASPKQSGNPRYKWDLGSKLS